MDEQIEKMAERIIAVQREFEKHCGERPCRECEFDKYINCESRYKAEAFYNAGYRKQEWISVDEKLPEKYTIVLCYFKYEPESPNVICENLYLGSKLWLSDGNKVTHWMLLPEPPMIRKEDEGK